MAGLRFLIVLIICSSMPFSLAVTMSTVSKPKVLITHSLVPEIGISTLNQTCEVFITPTVPPTREEILQMSKGMHGILWATHHRLDAEALDAAGPQLKAISTLSAGTDHVDVLEVKRRNIALGHTPIVLNDAVADAAIGLMISAGRRFHEGQLKIANSDWNAHPRWLLGRDVKGSTVGMVGFGGIGQTIAHRLSGFNVAEIIYSGHSKKPDHIEEKHRARFVSFDELVSTSDFIFITCPLTEETWHLFNKSVFEKMKKTSVLVNVARGEIINHDDLYNALKNDLIFAAGLDVMTPEPLPSTDQLLTLDNIFIIPHLGSATVRARDDMATIAAFNVLRGIDGSPLFSPVP